MRAQAVLINNNRCSFTLRRNGKAEPRASYVRLRLHHVPRSNKFHIFRAKRRTKKNTCKWTRTPSSFVVFSFRRANERREKSQKFEWFIHSISIRVSPSLSLELARFLYRLIQRSYVCFGCSSIGFRFTAQFEIFALNQYELFAAHIQQQQQQ